MTDPASAPTEAACLRLAFPGHEERDRRIDIDAEEGFALSWTHSVEKERWEERFSIDRDGAIVLRSTRFKTFGAGVPDGVGERTRLEDGWVVMEGIDRIVDPYAILATTAQDYRLRAGQRQLSVGTGDKGTGTLITFQGENGPCAHGG